MIRRTKTDVHDRFQWVIKKIVKNMCKFYHIDTLNMNMMQMNYCDSFIKEL